jgi:selenoprotein W-related protein
MGETREAYSQGLAYEEHKARAADREALEIAEDEVTIYASDLVALKSLPERLKVLAILGGDAEAAAAYLAALGRLASDTRMLDLRVLRRDEHADLASSLGVPNAPDSPPTFVLIDPAFWELGRFAGQPRGDEARETAISEAIREVMEIVKRYQARLSAARRLRPPPATKPVRPVKVTITYCAACGYEPQTIELVQALMLRSRFDLSSIEVVVGEEGAFEVDVDGELVHSMYRDGGFAEPDAVIEAVTAKAHPQTA